MLRLAMVVGLVAALSSGCVTRAVMMRNSAGQVVRCDGAAAIQPGIMWRNIAIDECVEQLEQSGFERMGPVSRSTRSRTRPVPSRTIATAPDVDPKYSPFGPGCTLNEGLERQNAGMTEGAIREACK